MNLPISTDPLPDDPITTTEAAKLLRVHVVSVYRWIKGERLRAWKLVGRLRVSEAEARSLAVPVERAEPLPKGARKGKASTRKARAKKLKEEFDGQRW